ncbi:MAG: hypothetical protein JSS86_07900 [Cyanobacteria bacterium SZAS LIN-2]|nr:hypothetical protein [Cyanobacteria bacterium SZAS LIN-2]
MDTIISRMMQLLGAILVLGMVVSGVQAAQLRDWEGAIAFLCFSVVAAGIFTTIWTMSTYHITALIGKSHKRSDFTDKSIVGTSVGVLALFTCVGFVTAGLSATNGTDNTFALWFYALGALSTGILCWIWAYAEYVFIEKNK